MQVSAILNQIILGAILGMVGQSARVVVGLKKAIDEAELQGLTFKEKFSPSVLMVSLIIGAVAGVLAIIGMQAPDATAMTKEMMLALIGAGYAGTDFIEGFMKRPGTPLKTPAELPAAANLAFAARRRVAFAGLPSKGDVVTDAVLAQLKADGNSISDFNRVMADDFHYDFDGIRDFLSVVRSRLAKSTPAYNFDFDDDFAKQALTQTVIDLIAAISEKTNPA